MKRIVLILTFLAIVIATLAQAPQKVSYQAVIRNSSGNLVTNRQISLRISILKAVPMGSINNPINTRAGIIAPPAVNKVAVYTETHTATTNANGLVSIRIGDGTTTDSFSAVDWSAGTYYIKTEVDVNGGSNYVEIGNTQLLSVPYALYANEAGNIPDVSHFLTAETDPQFNAWNKDYNDLINTPEIPTVPTNVSAFINDANYITSADVPAQVNADWNATSGAGQILNKPELFSGNYNDLTNKPEIPTVPTNVSAFTNDANYITTADVPAQVNADWNATSGAGQILNKPTIPTVPTNVSAFANDANYITSADVPAQVNADWNATSGAGQILNKPEIPTVPTNVSAFTNDANYITSADIPAQVNADWNATSGAGQILNKPAIPTVPTNVSAFTNDANYITSADVPAQVNADWNATSGAGQIMNKPELFSGNYNDLTNRPEIPVVPTNVSAFTNDANYITSADVPAQVNADWNATSGAGLILNKPVIPTVPTNVSAFTNDANYLTSYTETDPQFNAWDKDYNDLTNRPEIPVVPTNVSAFDNDANYLTSYTETDPTISAWAKAENKPVYDYSEITNTPELFDGNYNNLTNTPDLSSYITDETQTLTDVVALSNSAGDRQIKNVADPTENQDAVTKKYVDELIAQFQAEISAFQNEIATLQAEIASLQGTLSATTFTVTFDANGGSGTMNAQAFGSGVEQALSANTFTKEHNNFVGWNTVADGSGTAYTDGQSITITESMTLYAQWTPITYTITFNANGGSGTMAEQIFAAGVEQTITANAFTRTYYTFIGWNTVADGSGTAYTNGQSITATENMTLYAQWEVATMGTFTDSRDGNTYEFVKIGSKIWMAENLRYTGNITLGTTIGVTGSEKQRCYPNGSSSNVSKYGYLYNWSAAMNGDRPTSGMQSLCPAGWHLPSHAEWTQLKNALSGNDAGSKLAGDAELWNDGALEQSSEFGTSGFNAVPAGEYNSLKNSTIGATPGYKEFGSTAYFWTSTCESSDLDMRYRKISYNNTDITDGRLDARYVYLSIRCVK
ncbi:MAG: InlB B-repeat-containing protein [Bacteroidales bacterium]|nr:InlB B-repeat-containing protein [Bacteroidales bacterium]